MKLLCNKGPVQVLGNYKRLLQYFGAKLRCWQEILTGA